MTLEPAGLLTPIAERDLAAAIRSSRKEFGSKAAVRLLARMVTAFERIELAPALHEVRILDDGRAYRCRVVKPFLICYREIDGRLRVFAILHGARDVSSLLQKRF